MEYVKKRYTSSQVRERLSDALDAAERGEDVVIERRGARFILRLEPSGRVVARHKKSIIEAVDPAVAAGQWSWSWKPGGLAFTKRQRR